jgi:hypothetical protein
MTVDPAGLEQAVVHAHVLTGTHAPRTHWSDTMGGLRGVHLTASVATFDDRMSAVTRENAPFARVTDSLPLKRAEGTVPESPPTEPVVPSTQVGTRAEAVSRGTGSSGRPSASSVGLAVSNAAPRWDQDVERQVCWTMKGLRWASRGRSRLWHHRYPELRSWSGRTSSTLPVRNG